MTIFPRERSARRAAGAILVLASVMTFSLGAAAPVSGPSREPLAPGCVPRPQCSMSYSGQDAANPLQAQLNCGPVYLYQNGFGSGVIGGPGSFCPDSVDTRATLKAHGMRGFLPGYCDTCMTVPDGMVFVFWYELFGPSCPSGCTPGPAAPPF